MTQSKIQTSSPPVSKPAVPTAGEQFPDGNFIELVRPRNSVRPGLLLWDGRDQVIGEVVEHREQRYKARAIHSTIFRALNLPANVGVCGSVRDLVSEITKLIEKFVDLPETPTALVARFVLATWLIDAMPVAPRLIIGGPDSTRTRQLVRLLHCVCRRALPMAEVNPAGLCSLASGMRFTLLLRQSNISPKLSTVLQAATIRGNPLLRHGELQDLFGAQAIQCPAGFEEETCPCSIRVPCMSIGEPVSILDDEQQRRIIEEFQPKLLAFRFANYEAASATAFDASKFVLALRELATSLAAATPGESDLQAELHALLKDDNAEAESAIWIDLDTVVIEAILVHCREAEQQSVYVGAIAEMAEVILKRRGEVRKIDAGGAGRRLRNLGFATEPRDARGVKLRLTNEVCIRAQALARQLQVPGAESM